MDKFFSKLEEKGVRQIAEEIAEQRPYWTLADFKDYLERKMYPVKRSLGEFAPTTMPWSWHFLGVKKDRKLTDILKDKALMEDWAVLDSKLTEDYFDFNPGIREF